MKIILLMISLLMITSCLKSKKPLAFEEIDYRLTSEWIYAKSLQDSILFNEVIGRPPGVEQLIFSLSIVDQGGLSTSRHCIYYTVPYKEKKGTLKIDIVDHNLNCPSQSMGKTSLMIIEDINQLKVSFQNSELRLNFYYGDRERNIVVPFYNLESSRNHEKYLPQKSQSYLPGVKLLKTNEESFELGKGSKLGRLSDRFGHGTAIRCHEVNDKCQTVGEYRCEQCRYGWYEVVDHNCPTGGSKFCGQSFCGQKNEPACIRGSQVVDGLERGICTGELTAVVNSEKILVCQ